jgi:drug/metabolite transporter (DMT)-like permease
LGQANVCHDSVAIYGSHVILINLSKDKNGHVPFNSITVVLMIEFSKFAFSLVGYVVQTYCNKGKPGVAVNKEPSDGKLQHRRPFDFLSWIVYIVPAALYSLNNNLVVHIQHYTDPATFQVLSNMKVPATALMYRLFIRRRIPRNKQAALLLLTIVGMSCSYSGVQAHREFMKTKTMNTEGGIEEDKGMHDFGSMRRHLSVVGLLLILLYASISAFAGVYTELIMKNRAKVISTLYSVCNVI